MKEELSGLPQMGRLVESKRFERLNKDAVKRIARVFLEELRASKSVLSYEAIEDEIWARYEELSKPSLRPLINATGIVIHTNLGRAPLGEKRVKEAFDRVGGYSNLEYDERAGKRGDRYGHLTKLARFLFGSEDILLVNNNAAAVFLILNTFSKNKECIVSRGELVEIGGGFRVPQVMANSGAKLKEVGTTNKTRIADYEEAIGAKTAVLMKAHKSNFAMSGFVQEAQFEEITALAAKYGVIDYYDLGSANLSTAGMGWSKKERGLKEIMSFSPSLISFSADKLFGSTQAGIILGKKALIDKLKKNQLLRMLRCDKLTLALVEGAMLEYAVGDENALPAVAMLNMNEKELTKKAEAIIAVAKSKSALSIVKTSAYAGGGSLPQELMDSVAICVENVKKPQKALAALRENGVIARIENDKILLDVRTIFENEFSRVAEALDRTCA